MRTGLSIGAAVGIVAVIGIAAAGLAASPTTPITQAPAVPVVAEPHPPLAKLDCGPNGMAAFGYGPTALDGFAAETRTEAQIVAAEVSHAPARVREAFAAGRSSVFVHAADWRQTILHDSKGKVIGAFLVHRTADGLRLDENHYCAA